MACHVVNGSDRSSKSLLSDEKVTNFDVSGRNNNLFRLGIVVVHVYEMVLGDLEGLAHRTIGLNPQVLRYSVSIKVAEAVDLGVATVVASQHKAANLYSIHASGPLVFDSNFGLTRKADGSVGAATAALGLSNNEDCAALKGRQKTALAI